MSITIKGSNVEQILAIVDPLRKPEWKTIWEEEGITFRDDDLHLRVRHSDAEDIGYVQIFLHPPSSLRSYWLTNALTEIIKEAVFGEKQDVILRALQLWKECNNEEYVAKFMAKHKPSSEPALNKTIQPA